MTEAQAIQLGVASTTEAGNEETPRLSSNPFFEDVESAAGEEATEATPAGTEAGAADADKEPFDGNRADSSSNLEESSDESVLTDEDLAGLSEEQVEHLRSVEKRMQARHTKRSQRLAEERSKLEELAGRLIELEQRVQRQPETASQQQSPEQRSFVDAVMERFSADPVEIHEDLEEYVPALDRYIAQRLNAARALVDEEQAAAQRAQEQNRLAQTYTEFFKGKEYDPQELADARAELGGVPQDPARFWAYVQARRGESAQATPTTISDDEVERRIREARQEGARDVAARLSDRAASGISRPTNNTQSPSRVAPKGASSIADGVRRAMMEVTGVDPLA